ncbi:MAG: stage III sporulation protein AD [Clostridia bacterium]|nr:stage III sporulation protein AD [Clostridia bacterium]
MNIFQLVGIAVVGAVFSVILRRYRPEFAMFTAMATGIILLTYMLGALDKVFSMVDEMVRNTGVDSKYFVVLIKIIGVSYIAEISGEICRDAGEGAIAAKIEMVGKMFIMLLAMPIIKTFLEVCIDAISML